MGLDADWVTIKRLKLPLDLSVTDRRHVLYSDKPGGNCAQTEELEVAEEVRPATRLRVA